MADYKEMYLKMLTATEKAINLLIDAQQECEEIYVQQTIIPNIIKLPEKTSEK